AYACGGFTATAEIPRDRASWGAIEIVTKTTEDYLRSVLEHATGKLGAYYGACMDEAAVERAGTARLQPLLDAIAHDPPERAVIALHIAGLTPLFEISPQQDFADATQVIASIDQAGLGLPDRKYYLEDTGTLAKT